MDCLCIKNISWWGMIHACSAFIMQIFMSFNEGQLKQQILYTANLIHFKIAV